MDAIVQHPVLAHFYENAQSLLSYLTACLPGEIASQLLQSSTDGDSYEKLMRDSLVFWNTLKGGPRQCSYDTAANLSLGDIIRLVQRDILKDDQKASNVLCFGFRMVSSTETGQPRELIRYP